MHMFVLSPYSHTAWMHILAPLLQANLHVQVRGLMHAYCINTLYGVKLSA
jgi:hypothetical protein